MESDAVLLPLLSGLDVSGPTLLSESVFSCCTSAGFLPDEQADANIAKRHMAKKQKITGSFDESFFDIDFTSINFNLILLYICIKIYLILTKYT